MNNHFNFAWKNGEVLITNDFGDYAFLNKEEFSNFITNKTVKGTEAYELLYQRGFIIDEDPEIFINERIKELRRIKGYAFTATALHIFAVTNRCNQNCVYCQAKSPDSKLDGIMSIETGKRAIEIAMQSPSKYLTFEFQGGEPLLNFDTVVEMINHSKELNLKYNKTIEFTIVTNLIALTDNQLQYLIDITFRFAHHLMVAKKFIITIESLDLAVILTNL